MGDEQGGQMAYLLPVYAGKGKLRASRWDVGMLIAQVCSSPSFDRFFARSLTVTQAKRFDSMSCSTFFGSSQTLSRSASHLCLLDLCHAKEDIR